MAGHSQFKNIMHRKGRQDAMRSKVFSKLAREITVAAKMGTPDPNMNPRLRLAVQNAKAESMPKDNIQRAINKAAGGDAENYDEVRYEGYGPGGVAVIVEALTDNRNRTASNVRACLHQGRRCARRDGLRLLHVRPRRRDRLSGLGRRCRQGRWKRRSRPGADDVQSDEEGHTIICAFDRHRRGDERAGSLARRGGIRQDDLEAAERHPGRRGQGAVDDSS
jgi:hypothetical protein